MKTITASVCSLAAFALWGLIPSRAHADHDIGDLLYHIQEHACHVQDHSRDLAHEAAYELYYDASYGHLLADIQGVARSAARLQSLARSSAYASELCREAHRLDRLVHHLEDTLAHAGDHGHGHHHGHRHHRGPDLRQARRLVRLIEKDTHDLLEDVERLERRLSPAPVVLGRRVFERPSVGITPGGVYVGGSGFSFRIGR